MENSKENTLDLKKSSYNPDYYMKWYNDNKEKRKEIMHNYYLKKKEKILERNTKYNTTHKDELSNYYKEYNKSYYEQNKEKLLKDAKLKREKQKEAMKFYNENITKINI